MLRSKQVIHKEHLLTDSLQGPEYDMRHTAAAMY